MDKILGLEVKQHVRKKADMKNFIDVTKGLLEGRVNKNGLIVIPGKYGEVVRYLPHDESLSLVRKRGYYYVKHKGYLIMQEQTFHSDSEVGRTIYTPLIKGATVKGKLVKVKGEDLDLYRAKLAKENKEVPETLTVFKVLFIKYNFDSRYYDY